MHRGLDAARRAISYLLLEEAEVAAGAIAAIGARLAIHLEGYFLVVGRHSHATLPQQPEDVVLHQHIHIVEQGEIIKPAHRIVGRFQELKDGMIEQADVVVKQRVHLLRVVKLLGDGLLHRLNNLVTKEPLWAEPLIDVHNLLQVLLMQELVDDIDAPDVLAEGEDGLNVGFAGDIAVSVLVATNANV